MSNIDLPAGTPRGLEMVSGLTRVVDPDRNAGVVQPLIDSPLKMSRFRSFFAVGLLTGLLLSASLIHAKDFTVGLSWNAKDSELVQKWEDYLQMEGKAQGEPAGINFKWVINVANGDPARP